VCTGQRLALQNEFDLPIFQSAGFGGRQLP
jgi:hypothetical protein